MGIRVIVFDLDGTLINSNSLKYEAYFMLFPADDQHAQIIRAVLSEIFEESRFVILEKILRRLGMQENGLLNGEISKLADRYNELVVEGAKTCPQNPGAEEALKKFAAAYGLYVSSTTPDAALKEILRFRKWDKYFRGAFGYPQEKSATLRRILMLEKLRSNQVIVVGDGESDRKSAMENGCPFVHVTEEFHFKNLDQMIAEL